MVRLVSRSWSAIAAVGIAAMLAACSDSAPVAPVTLDPNSDVVVVFPALPAGATTIPIVSDSSIGYCGIDVLNIAPTAVSPFVGGGGGAFDLTAAILAYNPGWPAPLAGSSWIGAQADANEYNVPVGASCFETTFNIPAGATSPLLNLTIRADNDVFVFLNGNFIGSHFPTADNPDHWNTNLLISDSANFVAGANTLRIVLVNTVIGHPGNNCVNGPPNDGSIYTLPSSWSVAECRNPSAVDFAGAAYYVPAPLIPVFVIGDVEPHAVGDNVYFWGAQWWKNNFMSGQVDNGVAEFKGYANQADITCGGVWASNPGNSSDPPATIASTIAVIVTTTVLKAGNVISGDIQQIVIVDQDGNYQGNPGHEGQGVVTSVQCTRP